MALARRSFVILATLAAASAAALAPLIPAEAEVGPAPDSMASMGDSITRGFNACGFYVDCPSHSFSTGTARVNSHYLRIRAVNPDIDGHNYNRAVTGADSADLPGQATQVVADAVDYVTILIGANDACTESEAAMTPVATFRANIDRAFATLKSGLPTARVFVLSVPDLRRLWEIGKDTRSARASWTVFNICQSMLANPASTAQADDDRRARVRQRVIDYNAQLAAACAAYGPNCRDDGNLLFDFPFVLSQVSPWDHFHPNATGQAVLARESFAVGFGW